MYIHNCEYFSTPPPPPGDLANISEKVTLRHCRILIYMEECLIVCWFSATPVPSDPMYSLKI
jgi:hypothetical protein